MHVYLITNRANDKMYVGQHSGDDLSKYLHRRCNMALRGANGTLLINRAIRKYGRDAFVIESLVRPIDKQQMDELEKFFIRTFETRNPAIGYNLTDGGGGLLGVVSSRKGTKQGPPSEETRRKIGLAHKGRIFSKEHLAKLSQANKGKGGKISTKFLTVEGRKAISDNTKAINARKAAERALCPQQQ